MTKVAGHWKIKFDLYHTRGRCTLRQDLMTMGEGTYSARRLFAAVAVRLPQFEPLFKVIDRYSQQSSNWLWLLSINCTQPPQLTVHDNLEIAAVVWLKCIADWWTIYIYICIEQVYRVSVINYDLHGFRPAWLRLSEHFLLYFRECRCCQRNRF